MVFEIEARASYKQGKSSSAEISYGTIRSLTSNPVIKSCLELVVIFVLFLEGTQLVVYWDIAGTSVL